MNTTHWIAALALTSLSFAAGCGADASDKKGEGTSITDTVVEASAATQAATGIAYYAFDPSRNAKAFAADGSVIATFDVSSEAGKSVLRVGAYGRQVEVVYSINAAGSVGVDGTANGTPFSVSMAKDGSVTGNAPKNIDPAFDAIFQGFSRDMIARNQPSNNTRIHPLLMPIHSAYCDGLSDAMGAAWNAGEYFAATMLSAEWNLNCT